MSDVSVDGCHASGAAGVKDIKALYVLGEKGGNSESCVKRVVIRPSLHGQHALRRKVLG